MHECLDPQNLSESILGYVELLGSSFLHVLQLFFYFAKVRFGNRVNFSPGRLDHFLGITEIARLIEFQTNDAHPEPSLSS